MNKKTIITLSILTLVGLSISGCASRQNQNPEYWKNLSHVVGEVTKN